MPPLLSACESAKAQVRDLERPLVLHPAVAQPEAGDRSEGDGQSARPVGQGHDPGGDGQGVEERDSHDVGEVRATGVRCACSGTDSDGSSRGLGLIGRDGLLETLVEGTGIAHGDRICGCG
jgi:hypothetical protein